MQKIFAQRSGRDKSAARADRVSAQNSHTGRSGAENRQKNNTAPPTMPSATKPRSSPWARESRKRNDDAPTARV